IAKVFDGGVTSSGRPYFVMELVKGVPFTEFCDQNCLTPQQRLELFLPVCRAVQHAHQKGIIHRDLKPSNILVSRHDTTPVVKVIDFGVAKALGQELTDKTLFTSLAQMIGTPLYMSPEQAGMSDLDVDTRSDIYSLGVLLYELLTGTTPFDKERLKQAGFDEVRRIIREEEPPKPSTRMSTVGQAATTASAKRQSDPRKLSRLFRGELDWIVMKALEKDRKRRYQTANSFAADVQHYLADEPVQACPPSAWYRLRKFVRRNKGPVLAVGVIVFVLVAGIFGITLGMVRALAAERRTIKERDEKEAARKQTRQALNTMTDEVVEDVLQRQVQLTDQHREFLKKVLAYHEAFAAANADDSEGRQSRAEGLFRVGRIRFLLGEFKDAEAAYADGLSLFKQLAADYPDQPLFGRDQASCQLNLGVLLRDTGRTKEAEPAFRDALALQQRLADSSLNRSDFHENLILSQVNLGILLSDNGRSREAELHYRAALGLSKELSAQFPNRPEFRDRLAFSYNNLAILLNDTGKKEQAEEAYREALAIRKKLVAEFPKRSDFRPGLAMSYNNLGTLLRGTNRVEEAESFYREALAIRKKLAAEFPNRPQYRDDLIQSYLNLGNALRGRGRYTEAEASYRDGIAVGELLVADFPDRPEYRNILAQTHAALGNLIRKMRPKDGESALEEAKAILKPLAAEFPNRPDFRQNLARIHQDLGIHWHINGRPKESETALREALAILKQLVADFPERPNFRKALAGIYWSLGNLMAVTQRPKEAEGAFWDALTIQKQLVADFPRRTDFLFDVVESQNNLGVLLASTGRSKEAEALWRDTLAIRKQLAADFPKVPDYQNEVAASLVNLAALYSQHREFAAAVKLLDEARPYHQAALKANGKDPTYRQYYRNNLSTLAQCYRALAQHAEVATTGEEMARFGYELPNDIYDAAAYLCHCVTLASKDAQLDAGKRKELANDYADRALALLHNAVELGYKDAARFPTHPQYRQELALCYVQLANVLSDMHRPKEAGALHGEARTIQEQLTADFPKVPDYQNELAGTLVNLAGLYKQRREFDAAVALLEVARPHHEAALKVNPKHPTYGNYYRNNLWVLADCRLALADHARLATTADELARFSYDSANDTYNAAGFLGRCVTLAEKDTQLAGPRRKELAQSYAERAMLLLRQAVAGGYKDQAHIRKDPHLEPLRGRDDFKKLLADLEAGSSKK
ncbi:MAG TPA: serine/threonine-protein kinase, partial [Gemmataceae bacterium]|nr:serine/threonine-protein kinase [Gemmataceae bacterium]